MTASFCIEYVDYLLIDMGSCGECVSSGFSYQCQAGISKLRPCSQKNNMHNFHIILCLARYSLCKFMWLTFHSCPRQQDFERSRLSWRIGKMAWDFRINGCLSCFDWLLYIYNILWYYDIGVSYIIFQSRVHFFADPPIFFLARLALSGPVASWSSCALRPGRQCQNLEDCLRR